MIIKEISKEVFDEFSINHLLSNHYQTSYYAEIKKKQGYEIMYLGAYKNGILLGATLLLIKLIAPTIKYGYAPRGFLIDYYDKHLFTEFTKSLKSYFLLKNIAFIKIDPEIMYSIINPINKSKEINALNDNLIKFLKSLGYQKLKPTLYFDSVKPMYNPIIDLTNFKITKLDEKIVKDIKTVENLGLEITIGQLDDIKDIYEFFKYKTNRTLSYYKEYYKSFNSSNLMDIIVLKLDYTIYLKLLQDEFRIEEEHNIELNNDFINTPNNIDLFNAKMVSDKKINSIKNEIIAITKVVKNDKKITIAGALVVKNKNRATVIINGHDKNYPSLNSKLYLFYSMIEYYKKENYEYFDMNGITIDFSDNNPYKELNDFKLKFKPTVYEYIGEFDLVINPAFYQMLWKTGKLHKEFQKERISI